MTHEDLDQHFRRLGCTPDRARDYYSPSLIRCGCGKHAMAATACGDHPDDVVKLFGAALSWFMSASRPGPLTFIVGKDSNDRWTKAAEALQMLTLKTVPVRFLADREPVARLTRRDLSSASWVSAMVKGRERVLPPMAQRIERDAKEIGFKWYRNVTGANWSGRLSGLQVCTIADGDETLVFSVGKPGKVDPVSGRARESAVRKQYLRLLRDRPDFGISTESGKLELGPGREELALRILKACAESHLPHFGSPEHLFESRVLRGEVRLRAGGQSLDMVDEPFPFQFPARWWAGGRPRYIDIMARQGATPWVVELKVDLGQGAYTRDGIVQACLYREYILQSDGLEDWFKLHGLDRSKCEAALVIPPFKGPDAERLRADHARVARELGVVLIEEEAAVRGVVSADQKRS